MSLRITCRQAPETAQLALASKQSPIQNIANHALDLEILIRQAHLRERFIERFNQLDTFRFFPNPRDLTQDFTTTMSSWKTLYRLVMRSDPVLHSNIFQKRVQQEYQIFVLTRLGQNAFFIQQPLHRSILNGQAQEHEIEEISEHSIIHIAAQALHFLFHYSYDSDYHRNACMIAAVETRNLAFIQAIIASGPMYPKARLDALFRAIDLQDLLIAKYFFNKGANLDNKTLAEIILRAARSGNIDMLKTLLLGYNIPKDVIRYAITTLSYSTSSIPVNPVGSVAYFDKPGSVHSFIIKLGKEMGYNMDPMGMCLGVVSTGNQAILLNEIDSFNMRLEKIAATHHSFKISSSDEAQAMRLTAQAFEKDADIRAFFDAVYFLQSTLNRDRSIAIEHSPSSNTRDEDFYSVVHSSKIAARGGIEKAFIITGLYDFRDLQEHLCLIKNFLDRHQADYTTSTTPWLAINLNAPLHTIGFGYNVQTQEFVINDSNVLPIQAVRTIEDLTQVIYRALTQQLSDKPLDPLRLVLTVTQVLCFKNSTRKPHTRFAPYSLFDPRAFLKTRFVDSASEFSILSMACRHGDLETLEALIQSGVDLDYAADGETPLILACTFSHVAIVKRLLKAGADVNWVNAYGETALLYACIAGNIDVVLLMLQAKANPNVFDHQNNTPLRYAIKHNNIELVSLLIEKGADLNLIDPKGLTPAHYAAAQEDPVATLKLLEANASLNVKDSLGWTPLMIAAHSNHVLVAQILIQRGADLNAINQNHESALHFAAHRKNMSIVSLLLDSGANIHITSKDGFSILHYTADAGDAMLIEKLLEAKAIVDAQDREGWTPLMFACQKNHLEASKILLGFKANPNTFNKSLDNSLSLAIKEKNLALVTLLIDSGADVNLEHPNRCTSLHYAGFTGNVPIAQKLLEAQTAIDHQDAEGGTPLMFASQENHLEVAELFLKARANPNLKDSVNGCTPLMFAAQRGHIEMIQLLLRYGANVSLLNHHGLDAASIARENNQLHVYSLLRKGLS